MNRRLFAAVCVSSIGLPSIALSEANCEAGSGVLMNGETDAPWAVRVEIKPEKVPLNAPFDARISICAVDGTVPTGVAVDATMPAHKHGMNYNPITKKLRDHHYETQNLLFHMQGVWRLEVTTYENQTPHRFTHDLKVQ